MNIKYQLKEIYKRVFLVTIKDSYDLAMSFCRIQEYYESPFKQVRGKVFTMNELQRLYSKRFGDGVFTYPQDWKGFNIPGHVVDEFMSLNFTDWNNDYDKVMEDIHSEIKRGSKKASQPYYVIGCEPRDTETIKHELCHAVYYLDQEYRAKVNELINSLHRNLFASFREHLLNIGYSKNVIIDEINAYICVDSHQLTDSARKMNKKEKKNFTETQLKLQSIFNDALLNRKNKK